MKNILPTIFLCYFLTQFLQVQAQNQATDNAKKTDDIAVIYSEEGEEESDFTFKEKYDYFTRADIQETTLVKVALFRTPGLLPGVGVEQKLAPSLSINVFTGPSVSLLTRTVINEDGTTFDDFQWGINKVRTTIGVRYYFDIMRRIKSGLSANNFSANYIGYQMNHLVSPRYEGFQEGGYQFKQTLVFGVQRRLGDFGYVDFNVGGLGIVGRLIGMQNFETVLNFQIGLGF